MIPVNQTNTIQNQGNCMSACIASILELECDDIPNFHLQNVDFHTAITRWLRDRSMNILSVYDDVMCKFFPPWMVGCYGIATVPSQNVEGSHAIVVQYQKTDDGYLWVIVHDPREGNKPYELEDIISIDILIKS